MLTLDLKVRLQAVEERLVHLDKQNRVALDQIVVANAERNRLQQRIEELESYSRSERRDIVRLEALIAHYEATLRRIATGRAPGTEAMRSASEALKKE